MDESLVLIPSPLYYTFQQAEGESDMGLALNRYIGTSILPILVKYRGFYADAESHSPLLEATLHTVYRYCTLKFKHILIIPEQL